MGWQKGEGQLPLPSSKYVYRHMHSVGSTIVYEVGVNQFQRNTFYTFVLLGKLLLLLPLLL